MKNFIVGLKLSSASSKGKGEVIHGSSWTYRGVNQDSPLLNNTLEYFILFVPDKGVCKDIPPKILFTFAYRGLIAGVKYVGPEKLVVDNEKDYATLIHQYLDFSATSLYKLPMYVDGVLVANPKRFILGFIGEYYLAYSPDLANFSGDITFLRRADIEVKSREDKGRKWLTLAADAYVPNELPIRLQSTFIEQYKKDLARIDEYTNLVAAQMSTDKIEEKIAEVRDAIRVVAKNGNEEQEAVLEEALRRLQGERDRRREELERVSQAYASADNGSHEISDADIEENILADNASRSGIEIGGDDNATSILQDREETEDEKLLRKYGKTAKAARLKLQGGIKTVEQLLAENYDKLNEVLDAVNSQFRKAEEDKAFGTSLAQRKIAYPPDESSFDDANISQVLTMQGKKLTVAEIIVAAAKYIGHHRPLSVLCL